MADGVQLFLQYLHLHLNNMVKKVRHTCCEILILKLQQQVAHPLAVTISTAVAARQDNL